MMQSKGLRRAEPIIDAPRTAEMLADAGFYMTPSGPVTADMVADEQPFIEATYAFMAEWLDRTVDIDMLRAHNPQRREKP